MLIPKLTLYLNVISYEPKKTTIMHNAKIQRLVQKDFMGFIEIKEAELDKDFFNELYPTFESKKEKYEDYLINHAKDDTIGDILIVALDYVDWFEIEEGYNQSQK